jgi:hypothetical protein
MDPVTAITTILSLIPDLLMTKGGKLIAGDILEDDITVQQR